MSYSHEPVHGPEEGDVLHGHVDGRQDDQHEDQGGAGDAGAGDTGRGGGQHHGDIVHGAQLDVVHLGNEDGGHRDEQSRPVHVDSCANGQNKLRNPEWTL